MKIVDVNQPSAKLIFYKMIFEVRHLSTKTNNGVFHL